MDPANSATPSAEAGTVSSEPIDSSNAPAVNKLTPVNLIPLNSAPLTPVGLQPMPANLKPVTSMPPNLKPVSQMPATAVNTGISPIPAATAPAVSMQEDKSTSLPIAEISEAIASEVIGSSALTMATLETSSGDGDIVASSSDTVAPAVDASHLSPTPAPVKSRIVRPDGGVSKIPTAGSARPKTPLRTRPSSAGRLQGNVSAIPSSAAPRSSLPESQSGPSFLKETTAWKNRLLSPEELEKKQEESLAHAHVTSPGVSTHPVSSAASRSHHYLNSTVSSACVDEKMAARIREAKAASSGASGESSGSREQNAVVRSRGATPTRSRELTPQRQRPSSAGPRSRPSAPIDLNAKPVYNRLFDAQAEMDKRRELAKARKEEDDMKQLTFKPTLYATPPSNLHARGSVKVHGAHENPSSPGTPELASVAAARTPPSAVRSMRGANIPGRTPPGGIKTPAGKATGPRAIVGGAARAAPQGGSDVFDRLSKLTTESLQADYFNAPPAAPAFSDSIVPEDHPSLSLCTSHPAFGVPAHDVSSPVRKVKYTPPAAAMPVVRSPVRTETVDEKRPVVQRSRSGVVSHKGKQETENKHISLPPPPVVSTKVSEAPPPADDSAAVEVALAVGEHVDESPMLSTDSPDILSSSPCVGDPGDKSQGGINVFSKQSPMGKMIDKKAAYESLLLETAVSSSDTLGSSLTVNVASSPLAQSGNGAVRRHDSSGDSPMNVKLGSVGAAGLASLNHAKKIKRGVPARRPSDAALGLSMLDTSIAEGGGGDVDGGNHADLVESNSNVAISEEQVNNNSSTTPEDLEERTVEIDTPKGETEDCEPAEINNDHEDVVDRMLQNFKIEDEEEI